MIGAADALDLPAGALGRTDLDHQINSSPNRHPIQKEQWETTARSCRAPWPPRPCAAAAAGQALRDARAIRKLSSLIHNALEDQLRLGARIDEETVLVHAALICS